MNINNKLILVFYELLIAKKMLNMMVLYAPIGG